MAIRIFTDSTSEISQKQAKELHIDVIPMMVNFNQEVFIDGVDLFVEDFYRKMRESDVLPKTSLINSDTFYKRFEEVSGDDEIIGIFISSELSGSLQSAHAAKELLPHKKIHLIDSRQVTFGLTALVLYAIRLRDEGESASEIVKAVEDAKNRLVLIAVIDTLKYLKLGGRLSSASAVLGTIMGVKPLLKIEDGKVLAVHKVFGLTRAFAWLVKQYQSSDVDKTMPRLFGHSDAKETLKEFQSFVRKHTDFPLDSVYPIGATVGVHTGPGAVGFCFFTKARK